MVRGVSVSGDWNPPKPSRLRDKIALWVCNRRDHHWQYMLCGMWGYYRCLRCHVFVGDPNDRHSDRVVWPS